LVSDVLTRWRVRLFIGQVDKSLPGRVWTCPCGRVLFVYGAISKIFSNF
jgi:hypothetical protein